MAAYAFVAAGSISTGTGNLTPGQPAGKAAGDLLLLATTARANTEVVNAAPTGWDLLLDSSASSVDSLALYGRIATGDAADDVNHDFWSGATAAAAQIACFEGDVHTTMGTLIAHSVVRGDNGAGPTDILTSQLLVPTDDCLVVGIGKKQKTATSNGATLTAPTGLNNRIGLSYPNGTTVGLVWDYTQQTTGTTIAAGEWTINPDETGAYASIIVALKTAAATPAPTFTASPTVTSQTASAYTIGYTADANADDIYVGAYPKDGSAPSAAQLKAGTGAHGTATEATTGAGDSIVLTPSDTPKFPLYDIYCVLEGAGGFSSVVLLADEFLDAPAGKQFITLTSVSGTSILTGASPTVVAGDIWVLDTVTVEDAYTITPTVTADYSIDAGGDTSRQSFEHDVYDVSLAAYYGAGTHYDGNVPPNFIGGGPGFFNSAIFKKDEDQGTIVISAEWDDFEGDTLTYAVQSGTFPTGWEMAADGDITTPPTAYGTFTWVTRVTDITGDFTDLEDTVIIGDEVPDVEGELEADAITAIEAVANFTVASPILEAYSPTVAAGRVVDQFPDPGEYVADDEEIILIVSKGKRPSSVVVIAT